MVPSMKPHSLVKLLYFQALVATTCARQSLLSLVFAVIMLCGVLL